MNQKNKAMKKIRAISALCVGVVTTAMAPQVQASAYNPVETISSFPKKLLDFLQPVGIVAAIVGLIMLFLNFMNPREDSGSKVTAFLVLFFGLLFAGLEWILTNWLGITI